MGLTVYKKMIDEACQLPTIKGNGGDIKPIPSNTIVCYQVLELARGDRHLFHGEFAELVNYYHNKTRQMKHGANTILHG